MIIIIVCEAASSPKNVMLIKFTVVFLLLQEEPCWEKIFTILHVGLNELIVIFLSS